MGGGGGGGGGVCMWCGTCVGVSECGKGAAEKKRTIGRTINRKRR